MQQKPEISEMRQQFPLIHGAGTIYLDNAATTQKPQCVLDAITNFYENTNANVHRASHRLSAEATTQFEAARTSIANFLNAANETEIIWTRGTTEAINLVAQSYGREHLKPSDEILLTTLEHHANIVPWQMVAEQTGAVIKVVELNEDCSLNLDHYRQLLTPQTKIVAISQVSNAVGTVNPVKDMISAAHNVGAVVLVDGAQAVSHFPVDVQDLDCDFYAFSGHKMFGPSGIGALYGKNALLKAMPPWQGGGEMIEKVSFQGTSYNQAPFKFEAGTPNIAGAIGMAAAAEFIQKSDRDFWTQHEAQLLALAESELSKLKQVRQIGTSDVRTGVLSFIIDDEHHSDIGMLLDEQGIAVRTGHHCAMPLMQSLGLSGTIRASFSIYNNEEDVIAFINGLKKALSFL